MTAARIISRYPRHGGIDHDEESRPHPVREAVGVFHSPEKLQEAIDDLLACGFNRAELSLLASVRAVDEKLGHRYRKISSAADDPVVPRAAYVSPEAIGGAEGGLIGVLMYVGAMAAAGAVVASGGTLAAAIIGAALSGGVGGLIGSFLAEWLGEEHGRHLQQQVERGGLLLWVRTWDRADEERAMAILRKHSGSHVHVHSLPALVRPQAVLPARSSPQRGAPGTETTGHPLQD
ncbi:MAG TPA: hypothetical protein VKY24_25465 [Reyranella sp.]|nr:hypothetical protein [Reyranella sp.]